MIISLQEPTGLWARISDAVERVPTGAGARSRQVQEFNPRTVFGNLSPGRLERLAAVVVILVSLILPIAATGATASAPAPAAVPKKPAPLYAGATNILSAAAAKELEAKWGIQITALRVSAAGNVIDFRYRVTDAEKASVLGNPKSKAELRDRASGKSLHVPSTKVGTMRSTAQRLTVGRTYTALFTNPGKLVKVGNKVDIIIGDFRAENLVVGD